MTPVQRAVARAREVAHEVKPALGLAACFETQHDWACDRLTGAIAAVLVCADPEVGAQRDRRRPVRRRH